MNINAFKDKLYDYLTLGFYPKKTGLGDDWWKILLQPTTTHPVHFFDKAPGKLVHPQLIFGKNNYSKTLETAFKKLQSPNNMYLPCVVGRTPKTLMVCDLKELKHLLISGASGVGKTCAVQSIIYSLMWLNLPNWLRLSLFSTKNFETFRPFTNAYTSQSEFGAGLNDLIAEMNRRLELLRGKFDNIELYNESNKEQLLRYQVVVFDEVANILNGAPSKKQRDEYERNILQLAMQGRSLGMFLIVMPQRADMDSIPPSLKSQLFSSLTFYLKNWRDAEISGCPEATELQVGQAYLQCGASPKKLLTMLELRREWVSFFSYRMHATLVNSAYKNGYK